MTAAIIYNAQHDSHFHLWATISTSAETCGPANTIRSTFGGCFDDSQSQIRACLPTGGITKAQRLEIRRGAGSRGARRRVARENSLHLARSGDARLDQRRQVLRPAGGN